MRAAGIKKELHEELLSVFIPTTPNPTSGFLIFVPKKDVIPLSMSVEQGIKFVISCGIVEPDKMPRWLLGKDINWLLYFPMLQKHRKNP